MTSPGKNTVEPLHNMQPPWGQKTVLAIVERFKQESMYGLPAKKSGRCREVAIVE